MVLAIPHLRENYPQDPRNWTCGVVVLAKVLAFFGQPQDVERLITLSHTTPETGTSNEDMERVLREAGLKTTIKSPAEIKDIQNSLDREHPVIVNYIEPKENNGHFAIVTEINSRKGHIILHDPDHGPSFRLDLGTFLERWKSGYQNHVRWLLAVAKE